MPVAGDYTLRCVACEKPLSPVQKVSTTTYNVHDSDTTEAAYRPCPHCGSSWLYYFKGGKIVQKQLDRPHG